METISSNLPVQNQENQQQVYVPLYKKYGKYILLSLLFIIVIIPFLFLLPGKKQNEQSQVNNNLPTITKPQEFTSNENISNNPYLNIKNENIANVLISSVQNFNNPGYIDLPNISEIHTIYPYLNDLILVGSDNILEVNPDNGKIIRTINQKLLKCSYSSVEIDNYLYLACGETGSSKLKGIYKVDLDLGTIVKSFTPKSSIDFTNLTIALNGTTIWAGFNNGVIKIETNNDSVKFYSAKALGFQGKCPWYNIFANEKNIWITPQASDCKGAAIYNPYEDKWDTYPAVDFKDFGIPEQQLSLNTYAYSKDKIYLASNGDLGSPGVYIATFDESSGSWRKVVNSASSRTEYQRQFRDLNFPDALLAYSDNNDKTTFNYYEEGTKKVTDYSWTTKFISITPKVNDKYYIVGNNGIYTLTDNSYPDLLVSANIEDNFNPQISKTYVNKNEDYALILSKREDTLSDTIETIVSAQQIDLSTGEVTDLIRSSGYYNSKITKNINDVVVKIENGFFEENADGIVLKDSNNKNNMIQIDLLNKKLTFL